jgi:hypothetical protein
MLCLLVWLKAFVDLVINNWAIDYMHCFVGFLYLNLIFIADLTKRMLPVYEAIEIRSKISKNVGHTEPWVVLANTPNGVKVFVAKLYTKNQIEQNFSVTNEIVCNILATQFDLKVPDPAFIEIPESLVYEKQLDFQIQFSAADPRLKFATEMISNVNSARDKIPKPYYSKRTQLDTLYAFDNLIRNADRGQQKTNLLLGDKNAFLIDHEYALKYNDISGINWADFKIDKKFTQSHLLHTHLKRARKHSKLAYFDEFQEYLRMLNVNQLGPYFNQLTAQGFLSQSRQINSWLNQVKQNSTTFVNCLKESLE